MLGWAFRAERVGITGALGIAVTMLGVVFVAQPPVIFGGHEWSHTRMAGRPQYTYQQRGKGWHYETLLIYSSPALLLGSALNDT